MPYLVVCDACSHRLKIPDSVWAKHVRGRVTTLKCKGCAAPIEIDGTQTHEPIGGTISVMPAARTSTPPREAATRKAKPDAEGGAETSAEPAPKPDVAAKAEPREPNPPKEVEPEIPDPAQAPTSPKVEAKKPEPTPSPPDAKVEPKKPEPTPSPPDAKVEAKTPDRVPPPAFAKVAPKKPDPPPISAGATPKKPEPATGPAVADKVEAKKPASPASPPAIEKSGAKVPPDKPAHVRKPPILDSNLALSKVAFSARAGSASPAHPKPFKSSAADWRVLEPGAIDGERPVSMRPTAPVWDRGAQDTSTPPASGAAVVDAYARRDGDSQPEIHQVAVDQRQLDSLSVRGDGPPKARRPPMATLQGLAPPDAGVQILHVPESEAEAETEPLPKVAARPALKRPNPGASETSADRARGESPAAPALPKTESVQVGAARAPPRRVPTGEHFPSVMVADDAEERDKNAATETRAKSAAEPKSAAVAFVLRPLADSVAEIPKAAADLKSTPSSVPPPSGSPSRWVVVVLALIALVAVLLFVLR